MTYKIIKRGGPSLPPQVDEQMRTERMLALGVLPLYKKLLKLGNTPAFAEMLAARTPPGEAGTDRAYWEGRLTEHDSSVGRMILQTAKDAGVSTQGKHYVSGLARHGLGPADPEAWVSGYGDILTIAKKRKHMNVTRNGKLVHQGVPKPEQPDCLLNPRLVKEMIQKELRENPDLRAKKPSELAEMVTDKYGAKATDLKVKVKRKKK